MTDEPFTPDGYVSPMTDSSEWKAKDIWVDIEHLLINECGLREDEGLHHQRPNIQNIIKNGLLNALLEERQHSYSRGLADGHELIMLNPVTPALSQATEKTGGGA